MSDQPTPNSEFILSITEDGKTRVECRFEEETIWLSQGEIAELYTRSKKTISEHLKNLFEDEEIYLDAVVRNFRTTAIRLVVELMEKTQRVRVTYTLGKVS